MSTWSNIGSVQDISRELSPFQHWTTETILTDWENMEVEHESLVLLIILTVKFSIFIPADKPLLFFSCLFYYQLNRFLLHKNVNFFVVECPVLSIV